MQEKQKRSDGVNAQAGGGQREPGGEKEIGGDRAWVGERSHPPLTPRSRF